MEQVFFQFHQRSVNTVTRLLSDRTRKVLEWAVLIMSVGMLALLSALHVAHVGQSGGGCLLPAVPEYQSGSMPDHRLLHVTLLPAPRAEAGDPACLTRGWKADGAAASTTCLSGALWWAHYFGEVSAASSLGKDLLPALEPASYSFSLDRGILLLSDGMLSNFGVEVRHVIVSADDECMGGSLLRGVLQSVIGFDTVVSNWFLALGGGRGFVRPGPAPVAGSAREPALIDLHRAAEFVAAAGSGSKTAGDTGVFIAFKFGVALTTLFLFFITTTLVAFTLRETQERMLKFTFLLHHHVRHHLSYWALILSHMVDSLVYLPIMVGTLFFLFEFFGHDHLLAFVVLCIVWCGEVYSAVAVRTPSSIRFYPRFFLLYFAVFHVYFFSFPFGFTTLALTTSLGFQLHVMLHFWNQFEV